MARPSLARRKLQAVKSGGDPSAEVRAARIAVLPELVRNQITTEDLVWASNLLGRLSDRQWQDAFRAGGYPPHVAERFIRALKGKLAAGRELERTQTRSTYESN